MNRFIPKSTCNSGDLISSQLLKEAGKEVGMQAVFIYFCYKQSTLGSMDGVKGASGIPDFYIKLCIHIQGVQKLHSTH